MIKVIVWKGFARKVLGKKKKTLDRLLTATAAVTQIND